VQNKLDDLYSLVKFIQVEPLDRKADWSGYITKPIQVSKDPSAFRKLQTLMRGITLRRVKTDLIDGKPILSLPDRKERVVMLELTPSERNLYDRIHQQGRKMFENLKSKGTVMSNFAMILKSILLMRQACLHPSLVKYDENMFIEQGDVNVNEKLTPELVSSMFHLLRQNEEDYCVMCNNTVEGSGNFMSPCKHLICSECIDNQFSKKQKLQATTQQLICPMCKIVINEDALQILDENVFETNDDELVNFDNQSVFSNEGTKIGALISDLEFIRGQDYLTQTVTKSVVFSQFTSMLTLCENALRRAKIKYCRIDGQMSRQQRSEALIKFKNNPTTLVFLISIKSGGVGLNLVSGNRVYLMEPYWYLDLI
jgi:SNF2 family DNA or RNA helicase